MNSVDFLPPYLQTIPNKRFLGSTLDLLIKEPLLKRFNGYIGRNVWNGAILEGNYLQEQTPVRQNYQLEPSFVTKDSNQNITSVYNFLDLLNSCANKDAVTNSWNRLLTNNIYSWKGFVDTDKLLNYQNYYWMSTLSSDNTWYWNNSVNILTENGTADILGKANYTDLNNLSLVNGMIINVIDSNSSTIPLSCNDKSSIYIVDGVDEEIYLTKISNIITPNFSTSENNPPDYITIARNATDKNLWSRTNLWVHKDSISYIITILKLQNYNFTEPTSFTIANRPIIEFKPFVLFNSGKYGLQACSFLDNYTPDAFDIAQGQPYFSCDGVQLNDGDTVIFNADHNLEVRKTIYDVNFVDTTLVNQIPRLRPVQAALLTPTTNLSGLILVDGYQTKSGDRILVLNQANSDDNGIYIAATDAWSLASDFSSEEQIGVLVLYGNNYKLNYYIYTPATIIHSPINGNLTIVNSSTFTIPEIMDPNSLLVWDNFPLDVQSSNNPNGGYTLTLNTSNTTINFSNAADTTDDVLTFSGWPSGTNPITSPVAGIPLGIKDGVNKTFQINVPPDTNTLIVWNNFPLYEGIGYTVDAGTITFNQAPASADSLYYICWSKWTFNQNPPILQLTKRDTAKKINDCILITKGNSYSDTMFVWNGTNWNTASIQKTELNQNPSFDVFDSNNISFGSYTDSSFSGSNLFSYAEGSGFNDSVLGFPLEYGNVGNLNDIIFDNNFVTDTFSYSGNTTLQYISNGMPHIITHNFEELSFDPWEYCRCNLELYQNYTVIGKPVISFTGNLLKKSYKNSQNPQVFVNGSKLSNDNFSVSQTNNTITINIISEISSSDEILIKILSTIPIPGAWYDVPNTFEYNPMNVSISNFSLGALRLHTTNIQNSSNDTSDNVNLFLKQYKGIPGTILWQEAFSFIPTLLLCNNDLNIDQAIRTAGEDYILFKQKFINLAANTQGISSLSSKNAVDLILEKISQSYSSSQPWTSSDMAYWGGIEKSITVSNINQTKYSLSQTYDFNSANLQSILVYRNNSQLIKDQDYQISGNMITFICSLSVNDQISIYEISSTLGNYIPATPTKLGLAPSYIPQIYTDYTYKTPRLVLQGHDGSITTCYGDYRDNLLLDYELRVFNNLKVKNQFLTDLIQTYVPKGGRWRSELSYDKCPYSPSELLTISEKTFYEWTANYNISYENNVFDEEDLFTWNWSSSFDKLSDKQTLLGYWRGIYNWFYDTEYVNTKPWESLGLTIKPTWWDTVYGIPPYTGGNYVLWNDIAIGIIKNPEGTYLSPFGPKKFADNSVLNTIPVDSTGNILDPNDCVVGTYNISNIRNDFTYGDGGPVEEAWKRNSIYPFDKLRSQILQNPMFMLGMLWDTNNYLPTEQFEKFKYKNNPATFNNITLNSIDNDGSLYVNSIINYSIENLRKQNKDPNIITNYFDNTSVQLMYSLSGYSSPSDLTAYGVPNNPSDVGAAELIPVQDYELFLNKSVPTGTLNYSGLVVNITENNTYQISGYNKFNPYFIIYQPITDGPYSKIGVPPAYYEYPTTFKNTTEIIPYNTVFTSIQDVLNFISGYEQFLITNGLTFDINTSQTQITWKDAAIQFLKWGLTNWNTSVSLSLVLNPSASIIDYTATSGTLNDLTDSQNSLILDINSNYIDTKYLDVYRDKNSVTITHQGGGVISCISADIISYEHRVIFDNITAFSDTIYDPTTGIRQVRLTLSGQKNADWTGTLDSPGFLICTKTVSSWIPNQDYLFGSLVTWKNNNYIAMQDIIGSSSFQYKQFQLISTQFINEILPNLSLKSVDYLNSYNENYRPFITDLINLRNNTLGYIERDWLSNLDIDLGAQTSFYKGWIKEKGTLNALNSYGKGSTSILDTQISLNEEYAMKVGVYGNDSRTSYADISMPSSINTKNPLIVSFVSQIDYNNSNAIQILPNNLYKKSTNWSPNFAQNYGNLQLDTSNFTSAGPVIPQQLINQAQNSVQSFIQTDINSLYFTSFKSFVENSNVSILKLAENGASFWIENNHLINDPNQWDVVKFNAVTVGISSITSLNSNTISIIFSNDINTSANDIIIVDYTDSNANVSISGAFLVQDYFIAPFGLASTSGYSNLLINTSNLNIGNISVIYSEPTITSDIYVSHSLRANSIAEGNILSNDNSLYVSHDLYGEAFYTLNIPYQNEISYADVQNGIPITSISYDNENEILWCGKPSANDTGVVELHKVTDVGNNEPTLNTYIYTIQTANPESFDLGKSVISANNFSIATANSSTLLGQLYIVRNNNTEPPTPPKIIQILNNYSQSENYQFSCITSSADAKWLYAVVTPLNTSVQPFVEVYNLSNNINPNISYSIISETSTTNFGNIIVSNTIPNSFSLSVKITNKLNNLSRVLIPEYEYITSNNLISIQYSNFSATPDFINNANYAIDIINNQNYYKPFGSILLSDFDTNYANNFSSTHSLNVKCNDDGTILAVGVPTLNSGNIYIFSRLSEDQYLNTSSNSIFSNIYLSNISSIQINDIEISQNLYTSTPVGSYPITTQQINFSNIYPAGTYITIEGNCFELTQIIESPDKNTVGFGSSLDISSKALAVSNPNISIDSSYNKGKSYLYELDNNISSTKIIPISDLELNTNPFIINNWIITPANSTILGLTTAINNSTNFTGIYAYTQNSNLILAGTENITISNSLGQNVEA